MTDLHWHDSDERYGRVSRALHWGMAVAMAWQFATALAHAVLDDSPLADALWGTHKPAGLLLMALVVVRAAWAWTSRNRRPPALNAAARCGHLALYALMVLVPALALLRQYGSGRSFAVLGVPVMPGFEGGAIAWMTAPGNLLHGWLGWALLALVVGHAAMAFVHRRGPGADALGRMVGVPRGLGRA